MASTRESLGSTLSLSSTTPSAIITPAITGTLIANAQCTDNYLTMLAANADMVWLNEPHPLPNVTYTTCYAPAVVSSIVAASTATIQPIDPMVGGCANAGAGYEVVLNGSSGYVACCPTGYMLHTQSNAPATRPASGATCYSNMPSTTTTVTVFPTDGQTYMQAYYNPSAQAFAHVIEGYPVNVTAAATTTSITSSTSSSPFTSSTTVTSATYSPFSTPAPSPSKSLSGSQIGGIIAGVILAALLSLALVYWALRRRLHRKRARSARPNNINRSESDGSGASSLGAYSDSDSLGFYSAARASDADKEQSACELPALPFQHELPVAPLELAGSGGVVELAARGADEGGLRSAVFDAWDRRRASE